jgi:hypothetical protein
MATQPVLPMAVRPMVRSDLPQEIQEILKKPLPAEAIGKHPRIEGLSSIKAAYVLERLNEAFGTGGWDDRATIVDRSTRTEVWGAGTPKEKTVTLQVATVQLFFTVEKYGLHKENFGGSDNVDLGDALKGARTDALTKIASELGVGLEIYKSGRESKADDLPACPGCKKTGTIIKGKAEYGGGYVCYTKKGGCGAKFSDAEMEQIKTGKVEAPKPPQPAAKKNGAAKSAPTANNVDKTTISAIVKEKRVEDRRSEGKDTILWLQVGEYKCATKQPEMWHALKDIKEGSKATLLVSKFEGKDGAIYQIHKVIPNVPDIGGRQ